MMTLFVVAGCGTHSTQEALKPSPAEVQAKIVKLMPSSVPDRQGWARDLYTAFDAQEIAPTTENICSVLAVTEQESTFQANPRVPGMGAIAQKEIDRRAGKLHIPAFLVRTALNIRSPSGKTYNERLASAHTEKELSDIFDDFIGMVPLGKTLFGGFNPVETGGPMQVSVAFAERKSRGYPYQVDGSIRSEVFTRRGGMYFGTAHLLGYPVSYTQQIYRFADYNAGWYSSRNAAFQQAVSSLTGVSLALDGDLIRYGSLEPGSTELAVRKLGKRLDMSELAIRRALEKGETLAFEESKLYTSVFELAEKKADKRLPRAILPGITLESPKITRKLTTAWFAKRVDERYQRCLARAK
ncbi:hypothetical protein GCM10009425_30560 [Pseudomonas asuensis]|uniref:DUF1615 domain-containing protein n=1 Tax=Pseudomonas asuensis TaxID=1825787 RepID=A0ABQ2GWP3_9PSED|nr:DUF1615 domain-containing protein [Pseudomonas asuensis]GGM17482.1 hypothetical protein GCM10009425_30560 [Pseudomonas asuensis]